MCDERQCDKSAPASLITEMVSLRFIIPVGHSINPVAVGAYAMQIPTISQALNHFFLIFRRLTSTIVDVPHR